MLQRFLIVWLCLSSAAAYWWPAFAPVAFDPFVASKPILKALIVVTMFAIGWMLPREEVVNVFKRWPTVLGGTAVQYLSMPALAYGLGHLFGLTGDDLTGVILVGCVPGAMASNVLTLNAHGNTSYSVSLTTSATLLSPIAVPLALGLALHGEESIDWRWLTKSSLELLYTVVIPVVCGYLLSRALPRWEKKAHKIGPIIANLTILWIIAVVVGLNRDRLTLAGGDGKIVVMLIALLGVNLGGYTAGYLSGWSMQLPEPMRRALTLEIGMQNAGLGAFLATQLFPDRLAIAVAPAMYTFGCMITGTILATIWAQRVVRERSELKQP